MATPTASTAHLDRVDEAKEETLNYALQLASSSVLPMALQAAIDLGIFEIIARAGPPGTKLSASEIAAELPARNPDAAFMLDRILRLLACHEVLCCSVDAAGLRISYGLNPVSQHFVRNQGGVSLCPSMTLFQEKVFIHSWYQLKNAVLEGGTPFDMVHGMQAFEYGAIDSRFNQVFNEAMLNFTTIIMKKLLESYEGFKHLKQLVDVGGGLGQTLKAVTSKYPHINGINFDLPHVIEHASPIPGVEHVGGDMFESVPKGDAIFMKGILHDWNDDKCITLLKNCYKAIPNNGKVIFVECVVSVMPEIHASAKGTCQLDVFLMTQHTGGKERTQPEFMALALKAGFRGINYEYFMGKLCAIEFFK